MRNYVLSIWYPSIQGQGQTVPRQIERINIEDLRKILKMAEAMEALSLDQVSGVSSSENAINIRVEKDYRL